MPLPQIAPSPAFGIDRSQTFAPQVATAPQAPRPWYLDYDNATLMQVLRERPDLAQLIPDDVINGFSNEFFLNNPHFQSKLTPERRATFGVGALGPKHEPQGGFGANAPQPLGGTGDFAPAGAGTGSAAAGDRTGVIVRTPTGASLREGGREVPLPPGLAAPIAGQQIPTYRSQGNLPIFSSQALARLTPGERQLLGVTVNRTGGRAEDFFEQQQKLFGAPQAGGFRFR